MRRGWRCASRALIRPWCAARRECTRSRPGVATRARSRRGGHGPADRPALVRRDAPTARRPELRGARTPGGARRHHTSRGPPAGHGARDRRLGSTGWPTWQLATRAASTRGRSPRRRSSARRSGAPSGTPSASTKRGNVGSRSRPRRRPEPRTITSTRLRIRSRPTRECCSEAGSGSFPPGSHLPGPPLARRQRCRSAELRRGQVLPAGCGSARASRHDARAVRRERLRGRHRAGPAHHVGSGPGVGPVPPYRCRSSSGTR